MANEALNTLPLSLAVYPHSDSFFCAAVYDGDEPIAACFQTNDDMPLAFAKMTEVLSRSLCPAPRCMYASAHAVGSFM
jgi:hypothetical protein